MRLLASSVSRCAAVLVLLAIGIPVNSATAQLPSEGVATDSLQKLPAKVDSVMIEASQTEAGTTKKQEIRKTYKPTKFILLQQKLGISEEKLREVTKRLEQHKRSMKE